MLLAYDACMRAVEAEVARNAAIPLNWYDVLLELAAVSRLRVQQLAERVVLSRTRVSRLVEDMTIAGLVDKRHDVLDRRVTWCSITDSGRSAFRETAPIYMSAVERHFSRFLTGDEADSLAATLYKLAQAHARIAPTMANPMANPVAENHCS